MYFQLISVKKWLIERTFHDSTEERLWLSQILKLGKFRFVCARFSQATVKLKHYITWFSDHFLSVLFYLLFLLSSVCELPVEIVIFNMSLKNIFNFTFPWFLFQIWGDNISAVQSDASVSGCHFLGQLKDLTKKSRSKRASKVAFFNWLYIHKIVVFVFLLIPQIELNNQLLYIDVNCVRGFYLEIRNSDDCMTAAVWQRPLVYIWT